MRKMRHILILVMAVLTVAAFSGTAFCEIYQTDAFTDSVLDGEDFDTDNVVISSTCTYVRLEGMYKYETRTTDESWIKCSVADGMVTTGSVSVESSENLKYHVFRDGNEITDATDNLSAQGKYIVNIETNSGSEKVLEFTIVNTVTGIISSYEIPEGFTLSALSYNGQSQNSSVRTVDLSEEGDYAISYRCDKSLMVYELNIEIDHTAPVLALKGVTDGVAKGPVDISDMEEDALIHIELNGEEIAYSDTLTKSGDYYIIVKDAAGNTTNYNFTIRIYFDINSWVVIGVIVLIIIGTLGYLLYSRRHLRVR